MNKETMPVILEHYMVKAVMVLSIAAVRTDLDDIRDDLRDAAEVLIRLVINSSDDSFSTLRDWCDRTLAMLEAMITSSSVDQSLSLVRLAILRLRSTLPAVVSLKKSSTISTALPSKRKSVSSHSDLLGTKHKKILEFIRINPEIRTRELIVHFSPILSGRTIKRCLKELVELGSLERLQEAGAVSYRALVEAQS